MCAYNKFAYNMFLDTGNLKSQKIKRKSSIDEKGGRKNRKHMKEN